MSELEQECQRLEKLIEEASGSPLPILLGKAPDLRRRFFATMGEAGFKEPREDRLHLMRLITADQELPSANNLYVGQAQAIIKFLVAPETGMIRPVAAQVFQGLLNGTLALWGGDAPMDGQPTLELGDLVAGGLVTRGLGNFKQGGGEPSTGQEVKMTGQQEKYKAGAQETSAMTYEEQVGALAALVDEWAVKRSKNVHGPYTSGDFVTWRLNCIFGPGGWSFTILAGPEMTTLNDKSAYVRVVGRLAVTFANGQTAHQDDIGIWPLKATRGGDLSQTAAERYETVEKAARTDCLKNAARNLGTCFAPLGDLELQAHIKREAFRATSSPPSAATSLTELYGDFNPDLLASFEELCSAAIEHLGYADGDTVTDALQRITGGDSTGLTYTSMWKLLKDHATEGK